MYCLFTDGILFGIYDINIVEYGLFISWTYCIMRCILWMHDGHIIDALWKYYGCIMEILWMHYGNIMDTLWTYNGCIMNILWMQYGNISPRNWTSGSI